MSVAVLARKPDAAPAKRVKASAKDGSSGLRIGAPDDAFEREADRVADAVMAGGRVGPQWSFSRMSVAPPLQRKCACGGSGGAEGECEECKEKKTLQRKAAGPAENREAPSIVDEVLRSAGQPLDRATRNFFESRFGHDFGSVRVHADAKAAASARAVDSLAYTVGRDLVFAGGHYAPGTTRGDSLLAHELAHVVQQSRGNCPPGVQRQRCGHDGQATKCGARLGVWKLIDQMTDEASLFSIDSLIVEGGLKRFGGGEWVSQVQTPPNLVKSAKASRGRIDGAKVMAGTSLDVEIVEIKSRSVEGGGCSLATMEASGYIGELRTLAPLIVPMSAKLAAVGGLKVEGGRCKTPKAQDKKTLEAAGVDFGNASSVNAWCFYNSLQDRLNRTFSTPFSAVNIRANADGTQNIPYQVPPPVVINCRKTKKNPKGLGLRFLEFQVNQKGGVSYGCRDICQDQDEDEKRKTKEKSLESSDEARKADAFQDIDKYDRLDLPTEAPKPGLPEKRKDPREISVQPGDQDLEVLTPQQDTGEDDAVQLPPEGVSEWDALKATTAVVATVAILHVSMKALRSPAEKAIARKLVEKTIEEGMEKGALEIAKKLDSAHLAEYGTKAGDVLLKEADEAVVIAAKASPRLAARLGPRALKGLAKAGPIIGLILAANDARAAISHISKGGTIELGPSLDDVDLSGDTKIKSTGPNPTQKPSGVVALKDTVVDIETKTAPNVAGNLEIDANEVTIRGAIPTDGSPVTINMKVKLSNTTITFKSTGVLRDGKILAGDLDVSDSQIEIDLPPDALDPGREAGKSTTIKGAKIKVTSLSGGGTGATSGSGVGGAVTPSPATQAGGKIPAGPAAGSGVASSSAIAPALAGPDRPVLIQAIRDDKDLLRLYVAVAGKEGVVPSDEFLRRFIALKAMMKRHPASVEQVIQNIHPGQIKDPIKDIVEPIEQTLNQENEKVRQALEKSGAGAPTTAGAPGKASTPATPGPPSTVTTTTPAQPGVGATGTASGVPAPTSATPATIPSTTSAGQAPPTAVPKATPFVFSAISSQLRWPTYEPPTGDQPPTTYTFWVEWNTKAGGATLKYKIPLSLTREKILPPGKYVWLAQYGFSAPAGTFTTEEGDLPIEFSDAGDGHYMTKLFATSGLRTK